MMNEKIGDGQWRLEQTGLLPFFLEHKNLPANIADKYKHVPKIAVPHAYQASNQCESIFHGEEGKKRACIGMIVVLRVKLQIGRQIASQKPTSRNAKRRRRERMPDSVNLSGNKSHWLRVYRNNKNLTETVEESATNVTFDVIASSRLESFLLGKIPESRHNAWHKVDDQLREGTRKHCKQPSLDQIHHFRIIS